MFNLVLMTKEAIRKEYNNNSALHGALQKSDVYFVNRKKNNQKHKQVLELKEDAEATDENSSNKEATTTTEKEEEATTFSEE